MYAPPRRAAYLCGLTALLLAFAGCTGINKIGEYDFADRTLAVTAPMAPPPTIITYTPTPTGTTDTAKEEKKEKKSFWAQVADVGTKVIEAGAEVARDLSAYDVQSRLDSAATGIDESLRALNSARREALDATRGTGRDLRAELVDGRVLHHPTKADVYHPITHYLIRAHHPHIMAHQRIYIYVIVYQYPIYQYVKYPLAYCIEMCLAQIHPHLYRLSRSYRK